MRCIIHLLLSIALLANAGCGAADSSPSGESPGDHGYGAIKGRVCDSETHLWLPDARISTDIYDPSGVVLDSRLVWSDREGNWLLDELPGDKWYDVELRYDKMSLGFYQVKVLSDRTRLITPPLCFDPPRFNVAVITGGRDDFLPFLAAMGITNLQVVDGLDAAQPGGLLRDPEGLALYDYVFLDSSYPLLDDQSGIGDPSQIRANLRSWVDAGGFLVASDLAHQDIESIWPDAIEFAGEEDGPGGMELGIVQEVDAAVSDAVLAHWLGRSYVPVSYDLSGWSPVLHVRHSVSTHLVATVEIQQGGELVTLPTAPLLLSFCSGAGRVVYSSFRAQDNASPELVGALQYIMNGL